MTKQIMDRLNIEPARDFTYELENKNTLPFLDILLIVKNKILSSSWIHFYKDAFVIE